MASNKCGYVKFDSLSKDFKTSKNKCILCDSEDLLSIEDLCSECAVYTEFDIEFNQENNSSTHVENDLARLRTEIKVLRLELASKEEIIKMLVSDLKTANSEINNLKQPSEIKTDENYIQVKKRPRVKKQCSKKQNLNNRVSSGESTSVCTENPFDILRNLPSESCEQADAIECNKSATEKQTRKSLHKPSVVVLGDSLVRNANKLVEDSIVYCHPGIRTKQLTKKVKWEVKETPKAVILHVGTNCLNSSPTPTDIMKDTEELIIATKRTFPEAKICISGILYRRDVDYRYIDAVNSCLDWICKDKDVIFVNGNSWVRDEDFGYDGLHLNRKGTVKFGNLLNRISKRLQSEN